MTVKPLIRLASGIFPNSLANLAYNRLTTPKVMKLREHEIKVLDSSEKETFQFQGFQIQLYKWKGASDKTILLIHGWEGQAGNFSDFIAPLINHGFNVVAFDGPSHGFSSKGKTSLFEFTELVGALIEKFKARYLLSHSFGGVATTYALSKNKDLEIDKYVLLTTPNKFTDRIAEVVEQTGISTKVSKKMINRLEAETGMDVNILNVEDFVKQVNVRQSLIIHDEGDKVIPFSYSKQVHDNWEGNELRMISGTGHFRILRTKEVIEQVVEYLN